MGIAYKWTGLLTGVALLLVAGGVCAGMSEGWSADARDLQARLFVAEDYRIGSFIAGDSTQRNLFGFPLEPIRYFESRSAAYTDFQKALLEYIVQQPVRVVFGHIAPVVTPIVDMTLDMHGRASEVAQYPGDPSAQIRLATGSAKWLGALSSKAAIQVSSAVLASTVDHIDRFDSLVRSREMQNRALSQVRMPLGPQRQLQTSLTERIGRRSGAFRMTGDRFQAQGGWRIEHRDGLRSYAFARYDLSNYYLANGAVITTLGEAPELLPLEDAVVPNSSANRFDWILNTIGRGSNWIGRNVSGGNPDVTAIDQYGQFELGNTTVDGVDIIDKYARLHDIEYYVSTHFPEGQEVKVPAPGGGFEYFVSDGRPGKANLRVIAKVTAYYNSPLGVLNALITRNYEGSRTAQTDNVVTLKDTSAMKPVNRRQSLRNAPGGIYSEIRVDKTRAGIKTTSRTYGSYRVTYDGAAVSRAVEQYNRTGTGVLEQRLRKLEGTNSREDKPAWWNAVSGPGRGGPADRAAGGGGPELVRNIGGVELKPHDSFKIKYGLIANEVGRSAMAAVAGGKAVAEVVVGGKRYTVARSSSGGKQPETGSGVRRHTRELSGIPPVGAFVCQQSDIVVEDETGKPLMLRRFYSSGVPAGSAHAGQWSWVPFELRINAEPVPGSSRTNETVVLIDHQAGMHLSYRAETRETATGRRSDSSEHEYRGLTRHEQPVVSKQPDGGYLVMFAHGFNVMFDQAGRLIWSSGSGEERTEYQYENQQLVAIVRGRTRIDMGYDEQAGPGTAKGSDGKTVHYRYDETGHLLEAERGTDRASYHYGEDGRLATLAVRSSQAEDVMRLSNTYDSKGRMKTHVSPAGEWRFAYNDALGKVVVSDADGIVTSYFHDDAGRLMAYGQGGLDMRLLNYDADGHLTQVARGRLTRESAGTGIAEFRVDEILTPLGNGNRVVE